MAPMRSPSVEEAEAVRRNGFDGNVGIFAVVNQAGLGYQCAKVDCYYHEQTSGLLWVN